MANLNPLDIRRGRLDANLSQAELADKLGVSQGLISMWETGRSEPANEVIKNLQQLFGPVTADAVNAFGDWVRRERERLNLTKSELAEKAGLSVPTIYKIEAGEIANPRRSTRDKISAALGTSVPVDVAEETKKEAEVQGLGEMIGFDPHDENQWPKLPGVYVLYDVSDRPVYVGQGQTVAIRLKDHSTRFWYADPIVRFGSFIEINEDKLRRQVEELLIKFLRKNAIINKRLVDDDER